MAQEPISNPQNPGSKPTRTSGNGQGGGHHAAMSLQELAERDPNFRGIWIGGKFFPNPNHKPEK